MKSLLLSILLFITVSFTYAQTSLIKSRESGYKTYIYRLSDQECFLIASKSKAYINDSFFHTLVDSFYYDAKYKGKLPYGNYLYVTPVKNQLVYSLETVQNVQLNFLNDLKNVQFTVTDLKGKEISDAVVEIGKGRVVKYDRQAHLYLAKSAPKQKVIKVSYQNVSNYFNFSDEPNRYRPGRYMMPPANKREQPVYKGYMVFNKPMYKPLDTVKFKTYLVTAKGEAIKNTELRVELCRNYEKSGKLISVIKPYRDGGYNFDFVLADSLGLRLDNQYSVILKEFTGKEWIQAYRGDFRYEDYELKSISFAARTDKEEYNPGSPVTVYLSAKDENGLAVPDGRVTVKAFSNNSSNYRNNTVFIPDSLWKTEIRLDPVGETKLVLPDRIFPKADLNFSLSFEFLNSNNERQTATKYLRYVYRSAKIKSSLKKDSLNFVYLLNGKPQSQKARLIRYFNPGEKADSAETELPLQIKLDPSVISYTIETKDGYKENIELRSLYPSIEILSLHLKDSLQISVNNPQKIPFWYTVFSGDQVLWKGYSSSLDTVIRHSRNKTAHIRLNYLWAGQPFQNEVKAVYQPGQLYMKLKGPETVYPGQQVKMEIALTGADEKPVPFTDITAYAMTSKFKAIPNVNLPDFNKGYTLRKQSPQIEKVDLKADGGIMINWAKWGKTLGLDTIAYYQFTHPAGLYTIAESAKDSLTQVAPFVVKDGEIQAVHVVYIDEVPVFFSKTDQLQHYSFPVSPGKHNIRLRTVNQMITLSDVTIAAGKKTILSVSADVQNHLAKVTVAPSELTDYESELLSRYLLSIQDNFREEKTILQAGKEEYLLNPPSFSYANSVHLVGPIAANYPVFISGEIKQPFFREPGYTYTFIKGLIKQRSNFTPYGFQKELSEGVKKPGDNYREYAVTKKEIDSLWENYLDLRSYTTGLFNTYDNDGGPSGQLRMEVDTIPLKGMPYVKNILIYKSDQPEYGKIYPGNTSYYYPLAAGTYRIMYLFKDNRYFIEQGVKIRSGGLNYFKWKAEHIRNADSFSRKIDASIKSVRLYTPSYDRSTEDKVSEVFNAEYFDRELLLNKIKGIVVDERKLPVAGATVKVKGLTGSATTNIRGEFELHAAAKGKIIISFIGFRAKEVEIKSGNLGMIILNTDNNSLNEEAVVGYSSGSVSSDNGTLNEVRVLQGAVSGLRIRGSSAPSAQKPLMIVDGLPFEGDMSQLNPDDIASMETLKDAAATSVWGSRAAGGVIIIKTKKGNQVLNAEGTLVDQTQTLRNNFSDYAFWQPRLLTNENGIASWTVKFPDDITSWTTKVIAMNGNKQSGQIETQIRSFKSLSANFVSPQFALEGDSISVIGKLMNYTPQEEKVTRRFSYNGQELRNNTLQFKNAHIDTIAIVAQGKDSLSFKYTLEQPDGYFDGELRKIPILTTGITETKGYFDVLEKDTTVNYNFQAGLGKVTLRAEASVFPVLLDEMEKLRKYEYLCNEQLASKLKSLLLEKSVRTYLGEPFKHEKEIKDIIKKLLGSKRKEGTWGWWQDSTEEMWISLHVVESLLKAEQQGYPIVMDKDLLYRYLVSKIDHNGVEQVKLIHLLNSKFFIKDLVKGIAAEQQRRGNIIQSDVSLYDKLQLMQLQQMAGEPVDTKWLMSVHKNTLFGSIYWGENNTSFWDNSIQNTLLAYQILKADGKHQHELELARRYFLEQRGNGQWRNTYESSLILETILPDLLAEGKRYEPASLVIDQKETIKDFPFTKLIDPAKPVSIAKKGKLPVYFTAYQQFVNPKPEKVSKDFTVSTSFSQEGVTVKKLKAGVTAKLSVEVEAKSDGDYVMIEIPIPAGCSYENKVQRYWGPETHREYFKNKTSIFCTKLKAGKYNFEIELMPRYSGNYLLNPAKAELMYFPVFYGREGMKRVGIN